MEGLHEVGSVQVEEGLVSTEMSRLEAVADRPDSSLACSEDSSLDIEPSRHSRHGGERQLVVGDDRVRRSPAVFMSALVGENPQGSEVILYLGIFTLQFSDLHVKPVVLLPHELHDHLGADRLAVVEAVESHLVGPRHLSPGPDIAHINIERL